MKKIILLDFMVRGVIKPFLSLLLATGVMIFSGSNLVAQKKQTFNELVTVEAVNLPIELIITQLSENNEINFSYNSNLFNKNLLKTINVQDKPLSKVLSQLFTDTPYLFQEKNGVIIIYELAKPAIQKVFELSGYVIDSITNKPIPDVNIFISYTSQGTSTDENGYYALKVNMSGIQELVFSHVGYSPQIKRLDFRRTAINMERTLLQPKLKMLNEIVIDASKQQIGDEELLFDKYFEIFKWEFLGETQNSKDCKIANPEVLNFDYDQNSGMLTASADELLIVENNALGYTISHLLISFVYYNGRTEYLTKMRFEKLTSENRIQMAKWERKRKKTFQGSFQHFLRALSNDNLKEQGFSLYLVDSYKAKRSRKRIKRKGIINNKGANKLIDFDGMLEIRYRKVADAAYTNFSAATLQTSYIEIIDPNVLPTLVSNHIVNPMSLIQHGYWSWKRTSDILPLDFDVNDK